MGVDYQGAGGVGVIITGSMLDHAFDNSLIDSDAWEDDPSGVLSVLGIRHDQCGDLYTGNFDWLALCPGDTLEELVRNAPEFVAKINNIFGTELKPGDLELIVETLVY